MSVVDTETGEIVATLTEDQAHRLVARINGTAAELVELIEQAWLGRAWVVLGYGSWDEFLAGEVTMPRLDRDRRRELVGTLRQIGMSTRAIATATGTDRGTIRNDLAQVGGFHPPDDTPELPATITGLDGKTYQATPAVAIEKPRRSSLTDSARSAGWDFRKAAERLERIATDDRFPANREQVAAHLSGHLSYAIEVCQDLLDGFDQQSQED